MPKRLPPRPDIEHLKKQAKALLHAYQQADAPSLTRVRIALQQLPLDLTLQEAQRVIALEYGFASWPKLVQRMEEWGRMPFPTCEWFYWMEEGPSTGPLSSQRDRYGTALPKPVLLGVENVLDDFALRLEQRLTMSLPEPATTAFLDQGFYSEYLLYQRGRSDAGHALTFTSSAMPGVAALDLSRDLLQDWPATEGDLPTIYEQIRLALEEAWCVVEPTQIRWQEQGVKVADVPIAGPDDIVVPSGVMIGKHEWWITHCYPTTMLQPLADGLLQTKETRR